MFRLGGLKEHAWKVCIRETVSRAETIRHSGCLGADRKRRHSNPISVQKPSSLYKINKQRGVPPRRIEGARLESVYTGNRIEGRDDSPQRMSRCRPQASAFESHLCAKT